MFVSVFSINCSLGRLARRVAAIALLALSTGLVAQSGAKAGAEDGDIRIVTQNMYVGSSFDALSAAQTPQQFVAAVAAFYTKVLATRPAERAAAMALEIAQNRADLVALQ